MYRNNDLRIDIVQTTEAFASLKEAWNALLDRAVRNTYFLRWEWLWTWWNDYREKNDTLCIILCSRGNTLAGLAPLYIRRKLWNGMIPLRRLMFLGTREEGLTSEYLDLICVRDEEYAFAEKIVELIASGNICDDAALHKMEAASVFASSLKKSGPDNGLLCRMEERYACPYIPLPRDYAIFTASLSPSLHAKINRDYRRLREHPQVRFRKTGSLEELERDFPELVRLHQARWESRGLPGSFHSERFLRFQQKAMRQMFQNNHLDLRFLMVGGRAIAALYNIRYNNKIYFYQSGLDTSFDKRVSAGALLHDQSIREAIASGMREYDFLLMGNTDAYKLRWTSERHFLCDVYTARSAHLKLIKRLRDRARDSYRRIKSWYRQPASNAC